MRNFTKIITLLLVWTYFCTASFAGDFVPKPYNYTTIGVTFNKTLNIPMTDLFEYPEEIAKDANLDNMANLSVTVESENTTAIDLYKYEYYSYVKTQYLYLWQYANKKGMINVNVKVNYNGKEVINTLKFNLKGIISTNDFYDLAPNGGAFIADVLKNDQSIDNTDKNAATISITKTPNLGMASVKTGTPNIIEYVVNPDVKNYSVDSLAYMVTLADGETSSATVKFSIHHNSYASKVIDFLPAPGQFTNEAIAKSTSAEKILGNTSNMISLGGFGGYVILGFDQPIVNRADNPYGVDFSIKGNSFIGNLYGVWTEPAAVQVMKDVNGNGVPDDGEWYELAGSDYYLATTKRNVEMTYYNPHYDVRYTIPWKTNQGERGALLTNQFHQHSYYPNPFDFNCDRDSVTYSGSIIRSSLDMSAKGYVNFYRAPAFGYSDNRGYNRTNLCDPLNPYFNDAKGNAGDGFDLNWAVDRYGNHVDLDTVHFVKIYTAGNANAGWLGEWSSEVLGVGITTPDPNYIPRDYYLNYIGVTQLKVLKGQTCQFEGFLFKNGRPVNEGVAKWSTSDATVGTVDNTGKFTAVDNGITWLYFSQKDDIARDSIQVKVVELKKVILEMEGNSALTSDSTSLIAGETIYITAQCEDNNTGKLNGSVANRYTYETFDWTASDPKVGVIDNGLFKGLKAGRTTVFATSRSNPELKDSILVIVNEAPQITLVKSSVVIKEGDPISGILKTTDLFTAGNKSVVYMNSVTSLNGKMSVNISNDTLTYSFLARQSGITDIIRFNITSYGKQYDVDIEFRYGEITTGLENRNNDIHFTAYPNPFIDYLVVKADNKEVGYLYNSMGQQVLTFELQTGDNIISTSNFPKGIYILKVKDSSWKLVK